MISSDSVCGFFNQLPDPLPLLNALYSESPVGIQLYSPAGYSLYVNPAFLTVFGVAPPPEYNILQDKALAKGGLDSIIKAAFRGEGGRIPPVWYAAHGLLQTKGKRAKEYAIESKLVPILSDTGEVKFVLIFFRDVTAELELERKKLEAEQRLKDANLLIDNLLHGSKAVIYARDLDGRFLFANKQYGIVTGLKPCEIIGKFQHDIHPPEIASALRKNDLRVLELKEQLEFEEQVIHPDGSRRNYLSLKFPLQDSDGETLGVCGISADMTATRQLENELNQARRMESLGLLASGVAHDFNNLLAVILLHTGLLTQHFPNPSAEFRLDLENIRGAVDRASALVRRLLAFGRKLPLTSDLLDVSALANTLSYMIQRLAGGGISVSFELSTTKCTVVADSARLEQVLLNLCMNSRDAMAGSGQLIVRTGRERLAADDGGLKLPPVAGDYIFLEVEDNGPGMTPEVVACAFEPFFSTKPLEAGSGLGLATVFAIAQESHGNIRVVTMPGAGCRIRFYIPESEGAVATREKGILPLAKKSEHRGTAVLVEDEPLLRDITARHLRFLGFTVIEAERGEEVFEILRLSPGVNLLVTDVIMPKISGPAMVRELERSGLLRGIGVIFISGYSSDELARYGIDSAALLEKPFTMDELSKAIDRVMIPRKDVANA